MAVELADDPAGEGGISVLSADTLTNPMMDSGQYLYAQSLVNGIARDKHYYMTVDVGSNWWCADLYYFDDLEYIGTDTSHPIDQLTYENMIWFDIFNPSNFHWLHGNGVHVSYHSNGEPNDFAYRLFYRQEKAGRTYIGPTERYMFSDVGPFPDIRTLGSSSGQGGGVDYAQVACVILCSFGLYYLFAGLWRSIRGRMG